jgi:hypothetical protein
VVIGGNIKIGPGSYYDDPFTMTVHMDVIDEAKCWKIVDECDASRNPIVMWQLRKSNDGSDGRILFEAHRLEYMGKNLDADTGKSPLNFAEGTAGFCSGNKAEPHDLRVHVRTDAWWGKHKEPHSSSGGCSIS